MKIALFAIALCATGNPVPYLDRPQRGHGGGFQDAYQPKVSSAPTPLPLLPPLPQTFGHDAKSQTDSRNEVQIDSQESGFQLDSQKATQTFGLPSQPEQAGAAWKPSQPVGLPSEAPTRWSSSESPQRTNSLARDDRTGFRPRPQDRAFLARLVHHEASAEEDSSFEDSADADSSELDARLFRNEDSAETDSFEALLALLRNEDSAEDDTAAIRLWGAFLAYLFRDEASEEDSSESIKLRDEFLARLFGNEASSEEGNEASGEDSSEAKLWDAFLADLFRNEASSESSEEDNSKAVWGDFLARFRNAVEAAAEEGSSEAFNRPSGGGLRWSGNWGTHNNEHNEGLRASGWF